MKHMIPSALALAAGSLLLHCLTVPVKATEADTSDAGEVAVVDPGDGGEIAPLPSPSQPSDDICTHYGPTHETSFPARTRAAVIREAKRYVDFRRPITSANLARDGGHYCNSINLFTSPRFTAGASEQFPYKQGGCDSIEDYDACINHAYSGGGKYLHGVLNVNPGGSGYARACGALGLDCGSYIAKSFGIGQDHTMAPNEVATACIPKAGGIFAARPGDLLVKTTGQAHVVLLTQINPAANTVKVYEAGYAGCCQVGGTVRSDTIRETTYNFGQLLTAGFVLCQPNGIVERVRNDVLRSDGLGGWSQTCDVTPSGALDCATGSHPFTAFSFPPPGLSGAIKDVSSVVFSADGVQKEIWRYMRSDGLGEYEQICTGTALPSSRTCTMNPTLISFPTGGLTLDPGTSVSGRFMFLYLANGQRKVRNGFVQSDGKASYSQTCDVAATGALDCAGRAFTRYALPPTGVTVDAARFISDRYTFVYGAVGQQKLRNGYVQNDGTKAWWVDCDLAADGALNCNHPFTLETLPPAGSGIPIGTPLNHRFTMDGVF